VSAHLVEIEDLEVHYAIRGGLADRLVGRSRAAVRAVDGVTLTLDRGEVLGLVGESGSGKTTLGRALLRLVAPTAGTVRYDGRDLAGLSSRQLRPLRRRMQMVFQDPHASLNPAMDLLTAIGHPLRIHGAARSTDELRERVCATLERVGLTPVEQFLHKYPSDLSGGQKQRAVLARAIILGPDLLVADEPVSMLDMSVRAKILELMLELKRDLGLTYVYVTHDLATARLFCDRVAIMYLGRIVEIGPVAQIFAAPRHPYTRALIAAVPDPDAAPGVPRAVPRGEIPDAIRPPAGCSFHPRCPLAFERCGWEPRDLRQLLERRWTAMAPHESASELATIGNLEDMGRTPTEAQVDAGTGHSAAEVTALLERVREESADDPFWRGVESLQPEGDGARVRFHPGTDPRLAASGGVQVACLLYD
jgi:oligopeptide/dipeptide ABC transporter ATP-binding protein